MLLSFNLLNIVSLGETRIRSGSVCIQDFPERRCFLSRDSLRGAMRVTELLSLSNEFWLLAVLRIHRSDIIQWLKFACVVLRPSKHANPSSVSCGKQCLSCPRIDDIVRSLLASSDVMPETNSKQLCQKGNNQHFSIYINTVLSIFIHKVHFAALLPYILIVISYVNTKGAL